MKILRISSWSLSAAAKHFIPSLVGVRLWQVWRICLMSLFIRTQSLLVFAIHSHPRACLPSGTSDGYPRPLFGRDCSEAPSVKSSLWRDYLLAVSICFDNPSYWHITSSSVFCKRPSWFFRSSCPSASQPQAYGKLHVSRQQLIPQAYLFFSLTDLIKLKK